jgi:hypothetical protein
VSLRFAATLLLLGLCVNVARAQDEAPPPAAPPVWAVLADQGEALRASGDLDGASVLIDRARTLADTDAPLPARVHLALLAGAVSADRGEVTTSLDAFGGALALDPSARLPETLETPRATAAFALALAMNGQEAPEPASVVAPVIAPTVEIVPAAIATEAVVAPPPEEAIAVEEPVDEVGSFMLGASIVGGFAWVSGGLPADSARPAGLDDSSPWTDCDARGDGCNVRVRSPGFGSTLAIRMTAHVQPVRGLWIGAGVRAQPSSGNGFLAGWLFDLELRGRPIDVGTFPLNFELILGAGLGQIQVRPPQDELAQGPYVQSGPGWVSAGAAVVVRVERGVELVGELLPRFSFPSFLFVLDASLSLRLGSAAW